MNEASHLEDITIFDCNEFSIWKVVAWDEIFIYRPRSLYSHSMPVQAISNIHMRAMATNKYYIYIDRYLNIQSRDRIYYNNVKTLILHKQSYMYAFITYIPNIKLRSYQYASAVASSASKYARDVVAFRLASNLYIESLISAVIQKIPDFFDLQQSFPNSNS
jgi:hypothetical protein